MYLLSETLPDSQRIYSKETLVKFFADGDETASVYQPAKWIVRIWDEQICSSVQERYGQSPNLTSDEIFEALDEFISEKEAELEANQPSESEIADTTHELLQV